MSAVTDSPHPASKQSLLNAIEGEIEPVPVSPIYRLGLVLVATGMILLPLLYVTLILLVAYATFYHATHSLVVFSGARGRSVKGAAFVYFGPLAIGILLILFMVKPLFAGRAKQQKPVRLRREDQPRLFAYVERLCRAVHAPAPREICVDCEVNASASFRHGLWSMFGNDLTLTIGLPLVGGMSLCQLSGILAHEFGHFSQGFGMRLTYVIRAVSFWFMRVVYERDAWDEKLDGWARGSGGGIGLVLQLGRFCVWLIRRVLWCLMWIGHGISGFMLRQMEFDADRHEARLAGSSAFEATSRRMVELSVAGHMAQRDLGRFFEEGRLADDLPRLIVANADLIPVELRREALKDTLEARTGFMDTHPATRDRIESAHRENANGIYRRPALLGSEIANHPGDADRKISVEQEATRGIMTCPAESSDLPAAELFDDLSGLARVATLHFYREALGRDIQPGELHPVDDLLGRQAADIEAAKALNRYFQGCCSYLRPIVPGDDALVPGRIDEAVRASLRQLRDDAIAGLDSYRSAFARYDAADTDLLKAIRSAAVLETGLKIKRQSGFEHTSLDEATTARFSAESIMSNEVSGLEPFERIAAARLTLALQLLQSEEIASRIDTGADASGNPRTLVGVIAVVNRLHASTLRLRNSLVALSAVLGCIEGNEEHSGLIGAIRNRTGELRALLVELRDPLREVPYPFDHARAGMTLGQFVFAAQDGGASTTIDLPESDNIGGVFSAANQAFDKIGILQMRLYARAAQLAERIESLAGLAPLPEPVESKPAASTSEA